MYKTDKKDKGEWVLRQLAGYFISLEPGRRIDSVRKLAAKFSASIGLVSERISHLESSKLIRLDKRGQLGSFLVELSIGELWKAAVQTPLVIAHTLPSNLVYEGLNTGLKINFNRLGIETYFIFIRGSRTRLKALRENRCNISVMSLYSAEAISGSTETIAITLPPGSFVGSHQIFYRKHIFNVSKKPRVAIDSDSYDQAALSRLEFNSESAEWVDINFMNIHRCLLENAADTAIWTAEDMSVHPTEEIESRPLSEDTLKKVGERNTQASLVVQSDDLPTIALLQKGLRKENVLRIQIEVIDSVRIPQY